MVGNFGSVLHWREEPGDSIFDDVGNTPPTRRDNRQLKHHGFDQHVAERFGRVITRETKDVRPPKVRPLFVRDLATAAEHTVCQLLVLNLAQHFPAVCLRHKFTDKLDPKSQAAVAQQTRRFDQDFDALLFSHQANEENYRHRVHRFQVLKPIEFVRQTIGHRVDRLRFQELAIRRIQG